MKKVLLVLLVGFTGIACLPGRELKVEPLEGHEEEGHEKFFDAVESSDFSRQERFPIQERLPDTSIAPVDSLQLKSQSSGVMSGQDSLASLPVTDFQTTDLPTVTAALPAAPIEMSPDVLQFITDAAKTPGNASLVLEHINENTSVFDKRAAVGDVASHVLATAAEALFGDQFTPDKLRAIQDDLAALEQSLVLTEGERTVMGQLKDEIGTRIKNNTPLDDSAVITTLERVEEAFRDGIISQSDAASIVLELQTKMSATGTLSEEMKGRIMKAFDVLNRSSKPDWTVQPASKSDLPIPSVPANTAEDAIAFIAESVKKLVTTPARSNSTSSDDYYVLRKQIEDIEKSYSLTDDQHNILNRYYEILSAH